MPTLSPPPAPAGVAKIERFSPSPLDHDSPLSSFSPAISADGRFVVFETGLATLYPNDRTNIFLRNRPGLASRAKPSPEVP